MSDQEVQEIQKLVSEGIQNILCTILSLIKEHGKIEIPEGTTKHTLSENILPVYKLFSALLDETKRCSGSTSKADVVSIIATEARKAVHEYRTIAGDDKELRQQAAEVFNRLMLVITLGVADKIKTTGVNVIMNLSNEIMLYMSELLSKEEDMRTPSKAYFDTVMDKYSHILMELLVSCIGVGFTVEDLDRLFKTSLSVFYNMGLIKDEDLLHRVINSYGGLINTSLLVVKDHLQATEGGN